MLLDVPVRFGVAATFLALLIGVIGISIQAVRIARERDHAQQAEQVAEQRRGEAERKAAIAQAVNAFLNDDLLASVTPEFKGKDVLMRDVLDGASEAIEERFAESPAVEASIRTTLRNTYKKLGAYEVAEKHLERALALGRFEVGEEHQLTRRTGGDLLELCKIMDKLDKARPLVADVLEGYRQQANRPDAGTRALNRYAWELLTCPVVDLRDPVTALDFARKAIAASNEQNSGILDTLSLAQHMTGESHAAAETQKKAVAFLPPGPSPDRTDFESSLAKYLLAARRFAEAEPLLHTLHRRLHEDASGTRNARVFLQIRISPLIRFLNSRSRVP